MVVLIEALEVNDLAWPPVNTEDNVEGSDHVSTFLWGQSFSVCHQAWILLKKHMVYVCCCACVCKYMVVRTQNGFFRDCAAFRDESAYTGWVGFDVRAQERSGCSDGGGIVRRCTVTPWRNVECLYWLWIFVYVKIKPTGLFCGQFCILQIW